MRISQEMLRLSTFENARIACSSVVCIDSTHKTSHTHYAQEHRPRPKKGTPSEVRRVSSRWIQRVQEVEKVVLS